MTVVFDRAQLCAMDIHQRVFVVDTIHIMLTSYPGILQTKSIIVMVCEYCRKGL